MNLRRLFSVAVGACLGVGLAGVAVASSGEGYSLAYRRAVAFLEAEGAGAWEGSEAQGLTLAEATGAQPQVVGPRSTSLLASLELGGIDARARRVRTLGPLGLDVSADVEALVAVLSLTRPHCIALNVAQREAAHSGVGRTGRRVPIEIDDALAIQGLSGAGVTPQPTSNDPIQDAIVYLLEFQLADGSWPLVHGGEAGGSGPVGDLVVTSEVVRALAPYHDLAITIPVPQEFYWINLDIGLALNEAASFLLRASYTNPVDRAVSLHALLEMLGEGLIPEDDGGVAAAHAELLAMQSQPGGDGSFGGSAFATALAARALLRAADFTPFAFDMDGDGDPDGPDPDADDDGVCDPGESGAGCSGEDAFPLDASEQADFDHDGVGDHADTDADGDGVEDALEPAFQHDAQESADADGDGVGDVADADDDNDGVSDVVELLEGLDPEDGDTDGDTFGDAVELARGTDARDGVAYPPPDGDIFPLGQPDGVTDMRDALLALRLAAEVETVAPEQQVFLERHGDVAPLVGGLPAPDGVFGSGDALVILRRVAEVGDW